MRSKKKNLTGITVFSFHSDMLNDMDSTSVCIDVISSYVGLLHSGEIAAFLKI